MLGNHVIARTGLCNSWEIMMPDNPGLRIINAQLLDELKKRMLLQLSPRIRGFTVLIKPTFITNCY